MEKTKKILMIIAGRNFRDEEFFEPKEEFEKNGFKVTTASSVSGNVRGVLGGWTKADYQLIEVKVDDYDAIVFVGGGGAKEYFDNKTAHKIARDAFEKGKVVSAICIAPSILANAGILKNKKATSYPSQEGNLSKKGAVFSYEPVVRDGNIITAIGPSAARDFGKMIIEALII